MAISISAVTTEGAPLFPHIIYMYLACLALSLTLYTSSFFGSALTEYGIIHELAEPLTILILTYIPGLFVEVTGFGKIFTLESTLKSLITIWALVVLAKKLAQAHKKGFLAKEVIKPISVVKVAKFWIKAVVLTCVLFPASYVMTLGMKHSSINAGEILGIALWTYGVTVYAVSATQKYFFKKKYPGDFASTGLWKYCRYPDLHGELVMWLGIFIISSVKLSVICALLMFFISPVVCLLNTYFLSGGVKSKDKIAEEKYGHKQEYILYKHGTYAIFPKVKSSSSK